MAGRGPTAYITVVDNVQLSNAPVDGICEFSIKLYNNDHVITICQGCPPRYP